MNSSSASCKEAVFSVQAELGLDLPRGVVLNAGQDPERLSCVDIPTVGPPTLCYCETRTANVSLKAPP